MLLLTSCASSGATRSNAVTANDTSADQVSAVDRPDGPAADISDELAGGDGVFIGSAKPWVPGPGYVEQEYLATGTAAAYAAAGDLSGDGRWSFEPTTSAEYRTRVLVRRPEQASDFSGTVLVEWLNVSGGVDADAEFVSLREEIERQGHAWVGVSAQAIGVEGGPVAVRVNVPGAEVAGQGLKKVDPARYGSLQHPGDSYAFDIYTQVARALRAGGPALGGLEPERVVAVGESQSAFALVTYINGVQPLTKAFDGFFVHSRAAPGLSLAGRRRVGRHRELDRWHPDDLPHRHDGPDPRSSRPRTTSSASSAPTRSGNPTPTASGCGRSPAPPTPTAT